MKTDTELLNAARRMDKDALVTIFDRYSPALFNYVLRLCGDPVLADHIVGDVFARLVEHLSMGKGPDSNLRSYLFETTYHRLIDEARYAKRRAPLEETAFLRQDAYSGFLNVEDQVIYKQLLYALQHELTDDQRHVIFLRFLEEFSIRETAAILSKTVGHVKVIQNRAIEKLRTYLNYPTARKAASSAGIARVPKTRESLIPVSDRV